MTNFDEDNKYVFFFWGETFNWVNCECRFKIGWVKIQHSQLEAIISKS